MIVYGIQSGQFIKVGVTNDLRQRLKAFQLFNPHPLKVVLRRTVKENYWVENRMHKLLAEYAIGREWFDCSPEQVRYAFEAALKELVASRGMIVATRQGWVTVPRHRLPKNLPNDFKELGNLLVSSPER